MTQGLDKMNTTKNPRNHFFHVVAIPPRLRGKAKYVARTISMARTISIKRKTALTIVHHPSPSRWLLRLLLGLHLINHFTPLQSKYLVDWMRRNTSATKPGRTALLHVSVSYFMLKTIFVEIWDCQTFQQIGMSNMLHYVTFRFSLSGITSQRNLIPQTSVLHCFTIYLEGVFFLLATHQR